MTEKEKCLALTKSGARCKRNAAVGGFCTQHIAVEKASIPLGGQHVVIEVEQDLPPHFKSQFYPPEVATDENPKKEVLSENTVRTIPVLAFGDDGVRSIKSQPESILRRFWNWVKS